MLPRGANTLYGKDCCCSAGSSGPNGTTTSTPYGHTVHTMLLPYLDQVNIYNQMNFLVEASSSSNAVAVRQKIPTFLCPSAPQLTSSLPQYAPHNYPAAGSSHGYGYCGVHDKGGLNGIFATHWGIVNIDSNKQQNPPMELRMITDGTSNTYAFSEFAGGMPGIHAGSATASTGTNIGCCWALPRTASTVFTIHQLGTPNSFAFVYNGSTDKHNDTVARSFHTGGVHALFMDGSVRFMSENMNGLTWRALGSPNRAEILGEF